MNEHRYTLEPYNGIKSRYTCPACGKPGVFVRYIDTETNEHLSDEVGRCNREDKCGYHYTPKQYFEDHPEREQEFFNTIKKGGNTRILGKYTCFNKPQLCTIPKQYLEDSCGYQSDLVSFLFSIFDIHTLESPTVLRLIVEYALGCTKDRRVIYWQIDANRRIRTGKIMKYNPETGKRIHNKTGSFDWVHSVLKSKGELPDTWELSQCLFGEHLLSRYPDKTVCLVEGEKSALIGSGIMPEYIWLATGGKQNLKEDKCKCLKGRNVVLFPDLGAFDDWKKKIKQIAAAVGFTYTVFDKLERIATPEEREAGLDVADYFIKQLQARKQGGNGLKTVCLTQKNREVNQCKTSITPQLPEEILQELKDDTPYLSDLIDELGLRLLSIKKQKCA